MEEQFEKPNEGNLKLFSIITGLFCAVLLISNVTGTKLVSFGPFIISGATILFPLAFIFNDILTETYGYELSRKVIWTGFACQILAVITYYIIGLMPPAPFWHDQEAYLKIFGAAPRIALASMTAYFCGEFANSLVLSKMKYFEKGKRGFTQAWRFVASTVVGEGVDSAVFITVAFAGTLATKDLITTIISIYILKVAYEIIATPFSTRFANWIKKVEGVDHIDTPQSTNYNPFPSISH